MLVAGGVALLAAGRARAGTISARVGDHLRAVTDQSDGVLGLDDFVVGAAPMLAWPVDPATGRSRNADRYAQVLVFRPERSRMMGFTAICTHAGCIVSDWNAADRLALCPCHGSEYDLFRAGAVARGPAPLPLPQLGLVVADGKLVVASGFDAPIGGHTGRTD